jgi:hypothetical protein
VLSCSCPIGRARDVGDAQGVITRRTRVRENQARKERLRSPGLPWNHGKALPIRRYQRDLFFRLVACQLFLRRMDPYLAA